MRSCTTYFLYLLQQRFSSGNGCFLKDFDAPALLLVQKVAEVAAQPELRFFHWEIEFPEAFYAFPDADQRQLKHKDDMTAGSAGFDAVVGNPPYDVLAEKELGVDLSELKAYISDLPGYRPALVGKQNLYKLFICRDLRVLRQRGRLGLIVPMPLLGDEQASGVRSMLNAEATLQAVEAFPQKDDPNRRVFEDAKLSTCIFVVAKSTANSQFRVRVHPGKQIASTSPSLLMRRDGPALYDPSNQPIVACSQEDWDLATRIMASGRMTRLDEYFEAFQGEANETVNRAKGNISESPSDGPLILRGSNICLYVLRRASQGKPMYLRQDRFLHGKKRGTKAWHFEGPRVGIQESCPQNNFRRLIACLIPANHFCNHKINYFPGSTSRLPLQFLLGVLNSKLADWFFRLGSTNAAVSHYQLYTLPVPRIDVHQPQDEIPSGFRNAISSHEAAHAFSLVESKLERPPFQSVVVECIEVIVSQVIQIETERGEISRSERSRLAPEAQPLQDLIDRMFFRMAGLSDAEAIALESRLSRML